MRRARSWSLGLALVPLLGMALAAACTLGFRGEAEFIGEHALEATTEIRIELPDTPITVQACAADVPDTCPPRLRYEGTWLSVAGSKADARMQAETPLLRFEREGGFAALRADVPLAVDGMVDLEMGEIQLPDDRHLDLRTGIGDISVRGSEASVVVDIEIGDVEIRGADGGLAVRTEAGDLDVITSGHAELRTGSGHIKVQQSGAARDLLVHTGRGDIVVTLASDANIDLEIHTRGRISVQTPGITTLTSGSFARRTGNASIRIELRTPRGEVEVRSVDPG